IPRLIAGDAAFALALTEPGAGSDAGGIITRATKVDGGWRVNGRKTWISGAESATFMVTACRTGTEKRGTRGVTMFLIPPDAPGISMTPLAKVGNNCSLSWDIGFEDVFVPDNAVLGEVGKGFGILRDTLKYARAGLAASVTGVAQAAVDCALTHAKERRQFGRSIGSFQTISHRLADMQTAVDLSRLLVGKLAWSIDQGADCTRLAAQAKLVATEALHRVTDEGMQIMASAGYAAESDMQRYWRDARLYTFGEGSNEIQRGIIARDLGLTED
ncbi:MAG: acyl-CoA dehydrogenase, partial [Rhodospirillales bacterium]